MSRDPNKENLGKENMSESKQKYKVVILMTGGDVIADFGIETVTKIVECKDIEVPTIFVRNKNTQVKLLSLPSRFVKHFRKRKLFAFVMAYYFLKSKLAGKKCGWTFQAKTKPANLRQFYNGDIHYLQDFHDKESVDLIASYQPDLCFHCGSLIIKEPLLSVAKDGILGYHHGDLTKHRGGLPCFWELFNNEKEVGVTMQILADKLDTGKIIMQQSFDIREDDTIKSLQQRVLCDTTDMAIKSILLLAKPDFCPQTAPAIGAYHKPPTLFEWLKFQYMMYRRKANFKKKLR